MENVMPERVREVRVSDNGLGKYSEFLKWTLPLAVMISIAVIALIWLFRMSAILTSPCGKMEIEYSVKVEDDSGVWRPTCFSIPESAKREDKKIVEVKDVEETLREQMNSWLMIFGFFMTLLGLIAPFMCYLLQQRSLSEERKKIKEDLDEAEERYNQQFTAIAGKTERMVQALEVDLDTARRGADLQMHDMVQKFDEKIQEFSKRASKRIDAIKEEMFADMKNKLTPLWSFLSISFDKLLVDDLQQFDHILADETKVYNYVYVLIIYMDCLVQNKRKRSLVTAVKRFRASIDKIMQNEALSKGIASKFRGGKAKPFVMWSNYCCLLEGDEETRVWVEKFFRQFSPRKFVSDS